MNIHDYATRTDARMKRAAAKPCACGHLAGDHRELGYESTLVIKDGVPSIEQTPRPGHEPGRFFCQVPGCTCTRFDPKSDINSYARRNA